MTVQDFSEVCAGLAELSTPGEQRWSGTANRNASALLSDQDVLQRREGRSAEWLKVVGMLEHSLKITQMVENVRAEDMLEITGEQKRQSIPRVRTCPGCQGTGKERACFNEVPDHRATVYRSLVIAATGCRPEELVKGVDLRFDGSCVVVKLHGAKVSEHSGQSGQTAAAWCTTHRAGGADQSCWQFNCVDQKHGRVSHPPRPGCRRNFSPGKPAVTAIVFGTFLPRICARLVGTPRNLQRFWVRTVSETQAQYGRRDGQVVGRRRSLGLTEKALRLRGRFGLRSVGA